MENKEERLENIVLKFLIRHPKTTAAALTAGAITLQKIFGPDAGELNLPAGALIYTSLTLAKDYWLGERQKVAPMSESLYQRIVTKIRNNPKLIGAASGVALAAQSIMAHPGELERATFSYLVGFGTGYWLTELNKQHSRTKHKGRKGLIRRILDLGVAKQKKSRKGLVGTMLDLYDSILERPEIAAAGVASYQLANTFNLKVFSLPIGKMFLSLTALGIVTALPTLAAYAGGIVAGGLLHTSSLRKFKLKYQRWMAEWNEDYKKATEIQEQLLDMQMSTKKRLKEMARLAKYYFVEDGSPSAMNLINERVLIARDDPDIPSALDVVTNVWVPSVVEEEEISLSAEGAFSEQGVELALYYSMKKEYEISIRTWGKIIRNSLNPDYTSLLKAQNLKLMGLDDEANALVSRIIAKNKNGFHTRFGSRFKVIGFDPETELGDMITIKAGIERSLYLRERLKIENNVSRYLALCARGQAPVPMGVYESEADGAFYMMSHVQGDPLGVLVERDKKVLREFMRELARFQRAATAEKHRLESMKINVPNLSFYRWGEEKIIKRLGSDFYPIMDAFSNLDLHILHSKQFFSNGDLHRDQIIRGKKGFCFFDFERTCFAWPAFTLFGILEDPRNSLTEEEKSQLTTDYLLELNKDGTLLPAVDFDHTYDMIYGPRMIGTLVMFDEYSRKDRRFLESAKLMFRKFQDFDPISIAAKEFKDVALDFIYASALQRYLL
ncbi:aminoglycoside phosphotransferase family protein [Candidatus Woesearchaeota archaeon]|nr:aminoglycoside phosphotransferase family protein [Candidatus Woesearchaeota archaeon]